MKKLMIIIFGLVLTVSQKVSAQQDCPIEKLIFATDLETMANLIDSNTLCFKEKIKGNDYKTFRVYINYLYKSSCPWVYHTNPEKEYLFVKFYEKYGYLYPQITAPKPNSPEFYVALKILTATDPKYFYQKTETRIPIKYTQWLRVQGLRNKFGEKSLLHLMEAVSKIIEN